MHSLAPDDIVRTAADARSNDRPPLLVLDALEHWLDAHGLGAGPVTAAPIGEGHSNVTLLVSRDGWAGVVRRPPRPPLPPSAHDVLREARVLHAIAGAARVPRVLAICEDPSLIGAPFYVMEKVDGHVVTSDLPDELSSEPDRRRMGDQMVEALAEIHAVDWQAAGLSGLGRPGGYLERQLRRFTGLWEHNRTRDLPTVDRVAAWLGDNVPTPAATCIVHGDFRLGNVMFAPRSPATIIAVLDWEMATLGDPLADLGYLTALWVTGSDPSLGMYELSPVTRQAGFTHADELTARYCERTGRPVGDMRWYRTLALWKSVVFMEGNHRRAVAGMTDDPYLHAFGDAVVELAERAHAVALGGAG